VGRGALQGRCRGGVPLGAGGEADPGSELGAEDEQSTLAGALSGLGARSRRVLELRFGIDSEPRSLDDVADELGVSRERVRRIEAAALRTLSAHPRLAQLRAAA
jgi:RNA polymerase primary sigma factor